MACIPLLVCYCDRPFAAAKDSWRVVGLCGGVLASTFDTLDGMLTFGGIDTGLARQFLVNGLTSNSKRQRPCNIRGDVMCRAELYQGLSCDHSCDSLDRTGTGRDHHESHDSKDSYIVFFVPVVAPEDPTSSRKHVLINAPT